MPSTLSPRQINYSQEELNTKGYTVLDNVLPEDIALQLNEKFLQCNKWETLDQVREEHYSHVFKFDAPHLPKSGEVYTAKFGKSISLAKDIYPIFEKYFIPFLHQISPFKLTDFDVRCHRQSEGEHYRTHVDGYAGKINLIYYVNHEWKWDWGGILNVLSDVNPDLNKSIFPKFNRVVLLNNKTFRSPHLVSTVEPFALNSRFSIVSFNQ